MTEPNITPKEARKLWIEALRSGKYEQALEQLAIEDPETGRAYCCLGVGCEVYIAAGGTLRVEEFPEEEYHRSTIKYEGNEATLPARVRKFYGLAEDTGHFDDKALVSDLIPVDKRNLIGPHGSKGTGYSLSSCNDNDLPFPVIAEIIEREPAGLLEADDDDEKDATAGA